jgi:hypothetical protein
MATGRVSFRDTRRAHGTRLTAQEDVGATPRPLPTSGRTDATTTLGSEQHIAHSAMRSAGEGRSHPPLSQTWGASPLVELAPCQHAQAGRAPQPTPTHTHPSSLLGPPQTAHPATSGELRALPLVPGPGLLCGEPPPPPPPPPPRGSPPRPLRPRALPPSPPSRPTQRADVLAQLLQAPLAGVLAVVAAGRHRRHERLVLLVDRVVGEVHEGDVEVGGLGR